MPRSRASVSGMTGNSANSTNMTLRRIQNTASSMDSFDFRILEKITCIVPMETTTRTMRKSVVIICDSSNIPGSS